MNKLGKLRKSIALQEDAKLVGILFRIPQMILL